MIARQAARLFRERFGRPPEVVARAPGRVNLIGEHIDYNGGLVLPAPINRHVTVAGSRRRGSSAVVYSETMGEETSFQVGDPALASPHWSNYIRGVTALLERERGGISSFSAVISSDLPTGAGLASSAALEVATALMLKGLFRLEISPMAMALLCQKAEHRFARVRCGIMDQMALAFSKPRHALLLDCRNLSFSYIPLSNRWVCLAVCDTGVRRALASSDYNLRRGECEKALHLLRLKSRREISTLCEIRPRELDSLTREMPEVLKRRVRHAVTEQARVRAAARALAESDFARLGRLLDRSHRSLARDYQVSSAELDTMVRLARKLPGVYGARLVGAGFGGAALALVQPKSAPLFKRRLAAEYRNATGIKPRLYILRANSQYPAAFSGGPRVNNYRAAGDARRGRRVGGPRHPG